MRACSHIAECSLSYDKDNANERKVSLLTVSRVQLILCKDNANERNESLLSHCRVQLILCKDTTFPLKCNYHDFIYHKAMRIIRLCRPSPHTTCRHHRILSPSYTGQYVINIILISHYNNLTFLISQSGKDLADKCIQYNRKGTIIQSYAKDWIAGKPVPHRQTACLMLRRRLFRVAKDTIRHDGKGSFAKQRIKCHEPPEV